MIDFSLQNILKDSPYDITLSEAGFIFQTDNGIHYRVSFDEEEIVLGGLHLGKEQALCTRFAPSLQRK